MPSHIEDPLASMAERLRDGSPAAATASMLLHAPFLQVQTVKELVHGELLGILIRVMAHDGPCSREHLPNAQSLCPMLCEIPVAATCDARCSVCLGNDPPGLQNVQTTTGGIGIVAAVGHCVCKLRCVAFGFHCTCPDESGNKILRPVSDLEGNANKQLHISGQSWRSFPLKHSGPELEEAEVWRQLPCKDCLTSTGSLQ